MQQQMEGVQQELANKTVEGIAGGGLSRWRPTDQSIASIKISPMR